MKQFLILFKCGFLSLSRYIEASLVNIINSLIFIFVQYFVWLEICKHTDYTFLQMLSYIIYSRILSSFYPSSISSKLAHKIKSGDICFSLLKPISVFKQLVYEELGTCAYKFIFISLSVLLFGLFLSHFQLMFYSFDKFIIIYVLSVSMFMCINLLFGVMAFYTTSIWGINSLKTVIISLLSGSILPLNLYPEKIRNIVNILPFRYLYSEPIKIIMGISTECFSQMLITELIWLLVIFFVLKFLYLIAVKRVTILGG